MVITSLSKKAYFPRILLEVRNCYVDSNVYVYITVGERLKNNNSGLLRTDHKKLLCFFFPGLLFSATMKKKVEWLCRDILSDPIRIVVGELGEVIILYNCFGLKFQSVAPDPLQLLCSINFGIHDICTVKKHYIIEIYAAIMEGKKHQC